MHFQRRTQATLVLVITFRNRRIFQVCFPFQLQEKTLSEMVTEILQYLHKIEHFFRGQGRSVRGAPAPPRASRVLKLPFLESLLLLLLLLLQTSTPNTVPGLQVLI